MTAYSFRTAGGRPTDKPRGGFRRESLAIRALAATGLRGDAGLKRPDSADGARFDRPIGGVSEQAAVEMCADPLSYPQLEKMTPTQLAAPPFDAARVIAPESSRTPPSSPTAGRAVWRVVRIETALRIFRLWAARRKQRVDLAEMEDHRLSDIGRSRAEIRRECGKWFWQE